MRLSGGIIIVLCLTLLCGCYKSEPKHNFSYQVVKQEPFNDNRRFVNYFITVENTATKDEIYKASIKLLKEGWQLRTETGKLPVDVSVQTYYKNDPSLTKEIACVIQSISPTEGRIAYTYLGSTTYNRDVAKPTLSREEKERQEEVGKFATDLQKAAKKAKNNQ